MGETQPAIFIPLPAKAHTRLRDIFLQGFAQFVLLIASMTPGEIIPDPTSELIEANLGLETRVSLVANTGDRPIQVGSHYHFFETNTALRFDRAAARGFRLNIPAGNAVRFEPGDEREVELVALAGQRVVFGFNDLVSGALD